ncbi:unnamed protein product [Effrenium voratum]|uniref:Uncharacterized protein n=1 Tax=Effrenium voratum TaxID=2562239 RepID=A0AA36IYS9_9DINO|nr:unnamed protein product [Effrenium voratum]
MAWLLAKAADTLKKAQDQLQDAEFIQKLGEVDIVQKAKDAAKEVATAANKVSESVQAEYRRTFEELDCQIFQVRPDLMIMEYPSLQTIERLAKRLNAAHAQKMLIFNLSEEPYESGKFEGEVLDLPLNGLELPPLKDLLQLCLSAQQWLATDQENVVVVHGREGFARAAAFAGCFQAFRGQGTPKDGR